jgi:hypothetical protein
MSRGVGTVKVPSISSGNGVTHIRHTEFFSSIVSTAVANTFQVASYPCNPGVASIFPWLSKIAQRYETYRFRRLAFDYHTRSATTQPGTVGMVFDFDAQDPAPASQMEALSYHDKSADSPWKDQCLELQLASGDRLPSRYTRAGLPATPYDIKTLDVGRLHVFVDGCAASTNFGLLEVNYDVDLFTPQVQPPIGGEFTATTGLSATAYFGTNPTILGSSLLPGVFTSASVFTFDQTFEGLVSYVIQGTGLAAGYLPVAGGPTGSAATTLINTVNAATTVLAGSFCVRAVPGTTLTPTCAATTVTSVVYYMGAADYDALLGV